MDVDLDNFMTLDSVGDVDGKFVLLYGYKLTLNEIKNHVFFISLLVFFCMEPCLEI